MSKAKNKVLEKQESVPERLNRLGLTAARKEVRRQIRLAYDAGRTVPYDLRTLVEAGVSLKVVRAVYRNPASQTDGQRG